MVVVVATVAVIAIVVVIVVVEAIVVVVGLILLISNDQKLIRSTDTFIFFRLSLKDPASLSILFCYWVVKAWVSGEQG